VRDGRIVDQWEQFDTLGVLGQLGLVPRPHPLPSASDQ
jgi:hypothetical protein